VVPEFEIHALGGTMEFSNPYDPMEEGKLAAADGNNRYRGGRHYFTWPVPNALAQLQRGLLTHECLQPNATRTLVRQV
jgi:hypothetical protein